MYTCYTGQLGNCHFDSSMSFAAAAAATIDTSKLSPFERYAVDVYYRDVRRRDAALQARYHGDPARVAPWDGPGMTYLWDFFPPSFNCPYRERLGRFSEGGKVLCNPLALSQLADCRVISVGV